MYKSVVRPAMLYGIETVAVTESQLRRVEVADIDIRRDQIGHMPVVMGSRQRCKPSSCKRQTVFKCIKCEVLLCLHKNSNSFIRFYE